MGKGEGLNEDQEVLDFSRNESFVIED